MPTDQQISRINDVLYAIHCDISAELSGRALSRVASYSEQHFHRVFKQVVGQTLNDYIRRTRLEHCANQLMFDRNSAVLDIAQKCGFTSLASFTHAFKAHFGVTPGRWRAIERSKSVPTYLEDPEIEAGHRRVQHRSLPEPQLLILAPQTVAYVRHQGYGRGIRSAWQVLRAWADTQQRPFNKQLGLHHSNPAWVPLAQCRYVACLAIDKPLLRRDVVNTLTIPGGLHAVFELKGRYGDLLPYLSKIFQQWLPESALTMQTTPAFVHYKKNHFLSADERFELSFYLPVSI